MPKNGLILSVTSSDGDPPQLYVWQRPDVDDHGELETNLWADLLRTLTDEHGPASDRRSPARVIIRVEPGDKYEEVRLTREVPCNTES